MFRPLATLSALLSLTASPLIAETYRLSTHGPEAHPLHANAVPIFARSVTEASGGALTFEPFTSGALAEGRDTLKSIKSGVAHGGLIVAAYAPADLPLNNVLNAATISLGNQPAVALAMTELTLTNPRMQEEWRKAGIVFGGGLSTPPLWLYCTKPVTNPGQLAGKKVWATSGTQSALITALGGVPVSVSVNDVYSGLQRGSLDCATNDPSGIIAGFRWGEIANQITTIPLGLVSGGALFAWNKDFWASLSPEDRSFLMDQEALGIARMLSDYNADTIKNVEGGKAIGSAILDPEESFIVARDEFNEGWLAGLVADAVQNRGIEDPQGVLDEFFALEAKWAERLKDVDISDADAVAAIIKAEIYDKVDAATYGTN